MTEEEEEYESIDEQKIRFEKEGGGVIHISDMPDSLITTVMETVEKSLLNVLSAFAKEANICPFCMLHVMIQTLEKIEKDMESTDVRH